MPFIPPETVRKARELDLLSYLQSYDPGNLVRYSGETYCTKEHDSLKISNGKWNWFSRGIGGRSALDYLIKVENMEFTDAVRHITDCIGERTVPPKTKTEKPKEKHLLLPKANQNSDRAIRYLERRGIDSEIIKYCIDSGRIYESFPNHNLVMLGFDNSGTARYASLRGIDTDFKGEASGSDKRFSFGISFGESDTVHVFESAIDLLSYATLLRMNGKNPIGDHLVSLAGVYIPGRNPKESAFPLALREFLFRHPEVSKIHLRLDNDNAGRRASETLRNMLSENYEVSIDPPEYGKDYNDMLCKKLGIPVTTKSYER